MQNTLVLALLGMLACAMVVPALGRGYEIPIPPGANCAKSCYNKANVLATKKVLFRLCGVSNVKVLTTTAPNVADMQTFCKTFIYYKFPSNAALVKYQNCEANQALYNRNMFPYKAPGSWWGVNGKPPKFSAC